MSDRVSSLRHGALAAKVLAVAAALLTGAFTVLLLGSAPARANPALAGQTATCPGALPDAYNTFDTVAGCSTTTTVAQSSLTLTVSYDSGTVKWQACGSRSLAGTTVQLYIDGQAMTQDGGRATVGGDGCTSDPKMAECLAPRSYDATAVDGPNQASKSFTVSSSGCNSPQVLTGSGGLGTGGAGSHSRHLAFTGSNVALLLFASGLLMAVGLSTVRLSRPRGLGGR